MICFLRCIRRCSLRCFAFTVWRIVGRGGNPVGPGFVSGGVRTRSVFKLSWPSTAEYRMMKLKKRIGADRNRIQKVRRNLKNASMNKQK